MIKSKIIAAVAATVLAGAVLGGAGIAAGRNDATATEARAAVQSRIEKAQAVREAAVRERVAARDAAAPIHEAPAMCGTCHETPNAEAPFWHTIRSKVTAHVADHFAPDPVDGDVAHPAPQEPVVDPRNERPDAEDAGHWGSAFARAAQSWGGSRH